MLNIARQRLPQTRFLLGDALWLPLEDGAYDRLFSSFFYGHLRQRERIRFLREARRVARELVVVEGTLRCDLPPERIEERRLIDGSRWHIYKRYFRGESLAAELGGGRVLFEGHLFVVVQSQAYDRSAA